ncbi:hypothetical protein YC2023_101671 [Brassica napus]
MDLDDVCQAVLQAIDAPLMGRLEILGAFAKWPRENEWMTDPIAIGDIDGPEGLDFVVDGVRVAELSTIVDMTGSYDSYPKVIRIHIVPWMVVDDDSRLHQDLVASGT